MPIKKLSDGSREKDCHDPDHEIPAARVFDHGTYEHTCPECGERKVFHVPRSAL